uniref:DUF3752 domain-containing protein n=1 Tax=Meloidogyne javanica TaxID=6303 RepID=A0A915LZ26_MELJA
NTKNNNVDNFDYDGPSTSSSTSTSSNIPKPPNKRSEQDEWNEKRAAELNKERNESLLDIHQKKRKLESSNNTNKNGGGESSGTKLLYTNNAERRPFNRDTDIEIRGLGSNKKASSTDPASLKERVVNFQLLDWHRKQHLTLEVSLKTCEDIPVTLQNGETYKLFKFARITMRNPATIAINFVDNLEALQSTVGQNVNIQADGFMLNKLRTGE